MVNDARDALVRAGGDEFIVLIAAAGGRGDISAVVDRLFDALSEPVIFDGKSQ